MVLMKKERNKSSKVSLLEAYCLRPDRVLGIPYQTLTKLILMNKNQPCHCILKKETQNKQIWPDLSQTKLG